MLAINYIYKNIWVKSTPATKQDVYDKLMEQLDAIDEENNGDNDNDRHVEESYMPNAEFFRYEGIVTHLYSDGNGRIDNQYPFNSDCVTRGPIEKGDLVICMARKMSDDKPIQIYKVEKIVRDHWDENVTHDKTDPIALETKSKWIKGVIKMKTDGIMTIDTFGMIEKPINVAINEIGCTFTPKCGDQIDVDIEYELDYEHPGVINPLGFYSMRPTDKKTIYGKITSFKRSLSYGLIDNEYLFYADVLHHSDNRDCFPDLHDEVYAEVIRCDAEIDLRNFCWRCIYMVKNKNALNAVSKDASTKNLLNGNILECDDEINNPFVTFTQNSHLTVSLDATNDEKTIQLVAKNVSNKQQQISKVTFGNMIASSQIKCKQLDSPQLIYPQQEFVYNIQVIGKICGTTKVKLKFQIDGHPATRCISIEVKKEADTDPLSTVRILHTKAYTRKIYNEKNDTIAGVRPVDSPHFIDNRLDRYDVPHRIAEAALTANTQFELESSLDDVMDLLKCLQITNYTKYFNHLLYFEEVHLRHEFRRYDRDRGHFVREAEYLAYQMKENIFESRPSIVIGDMIFAKSLIQSNANNPVQYQGFVHRIKRNRLLLKFDENFQYSYQGEDYALIFKFSRSKFVKQHNAVKRLAQKCLKDFPQLLFPDRIVTQKNCQFDVSLDGDDLVLKFPKRTLKWFNPKLNAIQKEAIVNILRGESRPTPYIIFGPPGTGKTSTLLELILQLYKKGGTNIIVAAPSNSAANWLTKLLIDSGHLAEGEFARIASQNSIEREQIPIELHEHCLTVDIATARTRVESQQRSNTGIKLQRNSQAISLHRILISTCSTFGSLMYMSFKPNHFTHVIIDESGQCTEPEIAIPISFLSKKDGQIILAGDPCQLGPVVLSPVAKKCGLEKSLLCRLLDRVPYRQDVGCDGFDKRLVTQLLNNYRSIPSILSAYSQLFYNSRLIANIPAEGSAEQTILKKIQTKPEFVNSRTENYGIYFIGVQGREEQTFDSTSWRNPQETLEVANTVSELYQLGFNVDDIGIITPYTLQVKDIRKICNDFFDGEYPKVGSVEEFQGQERNIIIVSTVRSKEQNISHDEKYCLGFINNARRTNVTISRARAALIVIGNPYVLMLDQNWRHIIFECINNGSYRGCALNETAYN